MSAENTPIEIKRYVLSPEFREIIPNVREGLSAVKEEYPEVLGMTVFGSMVKDTSTTESDIDGFIFIDKSKVELDEEDIAWAEMNKEKHKHISSFDAAVVHHYEERIKGILKKKGLSEAHVEGILIRSIDTQELQDTMSKAVVQKSAYLQKVEQYHEYVDNRWPSDEGKVEYPSYEEDAQIPWKIPALFYLQVGHELDMYRQLVISLLAESGEVGEVIWKDIISQVADMERDMRGSDYRNLFPTTLDEAKKYYRLE